MKSILISIKPNWCDLIANGKKNIEVRKNRPKLETPFKCYIYETKGKYVKSKNGYGCGKVIGEFVCEHIDRIVHCGTSRHDIKLRFEDSYYYTEIAEEYFYRCQLAYNDLEKYSDGGDIYGWHISELKIYDTPKELSHLYVKGYCSSCRSGNEYEDMACMHGGDCIVPIELERPPQSWCYIEGCKDA